jgi:hypothetical protein
LNLTVLLIKQPISSLIKLQTKLNTLSMSHDHIADITDKILKKMAKTSKSK